ncbi:hypothetical protein HP550_17615 [Cellulomonas humilata]|uniref:Uncharacterized protein n=1 Tax=Cellulomonas humilata TaxID=144055 RepID=A0A7Y6A5Z0_9CELL|nr:hypothetical protein [Cellulomonas humilata]NUU19069.1 hypothetical protein [Cellulomonas humilata]
MFTEKLNDRTGLVAMTVRTAGGGGVLFGDTTKFQDTTTLTTQPGIEGPVALRRARRPVATWTPSWDRPGGTRSGQLPSRDPPE